MKKILTLIGVAALGLSLHAQGLISLQNSATGAGSRISTNGVASGLIGTAANGFYFAVLEIQDPSGSTTLPTLTDSSSLLSGGWVFSGITATNATSAPVQGYLLGPGGVNGVADNNWAAGTTNFYVVVGWSSSLGSSWSALTNNLGAAITAGGNWTTEGYFGYSTVGYGASAAVAPGLQLFGTGTGQIQGFTLNLVPVPEPTTIALAGLGGVALLAFRRRKA